MWRKLFSLPVLTFGGAAACFLSLLIAYFYMQRYLGLVPCPLCILDRFAVAVMGVGYLLIYPLQQSSHLRLAYAVWGLNTVALAAGFVFAGRHIWLQHNPPQGDSLCLTGEAEGFVNLIARAFDADADCATLMWEFAGLTIPEQVLVMFVGFAGLQLLVLRLLRQQGQLRRDAV